MQGMIDELGGRKLQIPVSVHVDGVARLTQGASGEIPLYLYYIEYIRHSDGQI